MDADSNSFVSGAYDAVFCVCIPGDGYGRHQKEISWVFDDYGLLDETEQTQLNQELADIYDEYGYDAVLLISPDIGEEEGYRQYAAEFMQENDIGYGDTHEGMCIFHQPDTRNITIVFRGDTQKDFSTSVQDEMLDNCKVYLKADDPVGGYQSLIRNLRSGLDRISEGRKVRPLVCRRALLRVFLSDLFLCFLLWQSRRLMSWCRFSKMKTRVQQTDADAYTADGQDWNFMNRKICFCTVLSVRVPTKEG